ncbi:MAG TPA: glycosyltransferase family 1 protein [Steroidobacteraceae bacterium]|nr:glycosyltransferase family 1 protein [Steroidobacteraceae bacterium]
MKIMITTDAWKPQVNGVVRTLEATARELQAMGHTVDFLTPLEFATVPCPTYPDIRLSLFPGRRAMQRLSEFDPDALHIATEGPLGLAARRFALKRALRFTTAYHTRFPEYVRARTGLPLGCTYAFLRWFHGPAAAVMAPTPVVKRDLESHGLKNVAMWSRGVDLDTFRPLPGGRLKGVAPIFLYVGRVAVEKNIEAFLELDLPGSKWVAGVGPALKGIQARHPEVHYLGVLDPHALAEVYASADVFVFPSKTDTFGLVLLEAMACGVPVAAYPVTGPLDVIGDCRTAGVMHEDLRTACLEALKLRREDAAAHARRFSWRAATEQFVAHLHPRSQGAKLPGPLANASGA